MYKISVPIMNHLFVGNNRSVYVEQFKASGVERVLLAIRTVLRDPQWASDTLTLLKENVEILKENGLEPAVWIASTIGHGGTLAGVDGMKETYDFQPLVTLDGEMVSETRCPLDDSFRKEIGDFLAQVATCGANLIFLDDDFRLSQHARSICCACDLHKKRMEELCGEKLDRTNLRSLLFSDAPNKYRNAWIQAQGDSLRLLAKDLRHAVDRVDDSVCLALCSAHSPWDMDGTNPLELTHILAGKNPPVLRLHGAPYWAVHSEKPLITVFEIARMFASFCQGKNIELLAEGDSYPRPRYYTPSSYLELFDGVIRADGKHGGILKYMFDYTTEPTYETGYMDHHVRDLPDLKAIEHAFPKGANTGVRVWTQPNLLGTSDFSLSAVSDQAPYPWAGILLSSCGIPTVYEGEGICSAIFGQVAQVLDEQTFARGAILDATSAALLARKGVDVGCDPGGEWIDGSVCLLSDHKDRFTVWKSPARIRKTGLSPHAEICLYATVDGVAHPFAYRYENKQGQRFLVYMMDVSSLSRNTGLLRGYINQRILQDAVPWISGKELPVTGAPHPDLYILCDKREDSMAIAYFNCWADEVYRPTFTLPEEYSSAEWIRCTGELVGDQLRLSSLPAFNFAAVVLRK
ncbi:MAG: hypothetical protein IJY47_03070 [Clostridia bacterium]|nr:hypothetical protein [Clostridia bacterium]